MDGNLIAVFAILAASLVLFIWDRWRYDLVAITALMAVFFTGVVEADQLFSGFAHPAVITVAAVLIINRGLINAGVVDTLSRQMAKVGNRPMIQVAALTATVIVSSGFMNNVGALALMMPVAIWMSRYSRLPPSALLMPLSFGSLLGGLITLIGTPPNIIIALIRMETGQPAFDMFDFTPVGVCIALAGFVFITLIGWRLTPRRETSDPMEDFFKIDDYLCEVIVPEGSKLAGKAVYHLNRIFEEDKHLTIVALIRDGIKIPAPPWYEVLEAGDILVILADSEELQFLLDNAGLTLAHDNTAGKEMIESEDIQIIEATIAAGSPMISKTAASMRISRNYGVNLLAVARQGQQLKQRISKVRFNAGDILLLQGGKESLQGALSSLKCLPLAERGFRLPKPKQIFLALVIFGSAMIATALHFVPVQVAFSMCALIMVLAGLISLKDIYESIEWPVIVLLGAMFPLGYALESTGGAHLIADKILLLSGSLTQPLTLGILITVTMLLSNVVNNSAAAVLMAPIAINLAQGMNVSADPLLMGVAIGSSCAFLTPIGHQSNALVMAPGGYRFGDYWRLGLPLSLVVIATAVPLILLFWCF